MGLDFLDVAFRIEKEFGVKIEREDMEEIIIQNDVRVGDLYALILRKLDLQDNMRNSVTLNFALWREMQAILSRVTRWPEDRITLQTPLQQLFPLDRRRQSWEELQLASPYSIRELDYSPKIRAIGLFLTGLVAYVELGHVMQFAIMKFLWPLLGILGVWMILETYFKVLKILSPWRNSIPRNLASVKELCRDVLARNYEQICEKYDANCDVDSRCHSIWSRLVEILTESLGVDPDEVTFQSRLIRDLDMA